MGQARREHRWAPSSTAVTKIVPFGAFIELGQSIEGLVHISEMAMRHIDTPTRS